MDEAEIRKIVEKVIADNMMSKDEITKKVIEAIKAKDDKPWLIKKDEMYYMPTICQEDLFASSLLNNMGEKIAEIRNISGVIARTEDEAIELYYAGKMKSEYEMWCMRYPVKIDNIKQDKYFAAYDYEKGEIFIAWSGPVFLPGITYCANKDHIQAFINKVGEYDFKRYVMGIGLPKYFLEV